MISVLSSRNLMDIHVTIRHIRNQNQTIKVQTKKSEENKTWIQKTWVKVEMQGRGKEWRNKNTVKWNTFGKFLAYSFCYICYFACFPDTHGVFLLYGSYYMHGSSMQNWGLTLKFILVTLFCHQLKLVILRLSSMYGESG